MAYRNKCFKNVRFYSGLGTLSCDCRGFVVEIAVFEKYKLNKIKGLVVQGFHSRDVKDIPFYGLYWSLNVSISDL